MVRDDLNLISKIFATNSNNSMGYFSKKLNLRQLSLDYLQVVKIYSSCEFAYQIKGVSIIREI
jgi:hypothetical protein